MRASSPAPTLELEKSMVASGTEIVAGVDEVGRGSWAGPASVGVALLDPARLHQGVPPWLRESKAMTEMRRESLFDAVADWCLGWAVGSSTNLECDSLGMTAALALATRRALEKLAEDLGSARVRIILDGSHDYLGDCRVTTVVGGDRSSALVAAASVLAKVTRDRYMRDLDPSFPPFEFASNKGYPSPAHRRALAGFGPTSMHRTSWSYMDDLPWFDGELGVSKGESRRPGSGLNSGLRRGGRFLG